MTSFRYGLYVHIDWTTKVVSPLHLARTLGYVEGIWSRYLAYCIVYVHVYIFANVKESTDFAFANNVIKCKKNCSVAKCFAKGKFVLLDSVLTSIHNKNLLSIKQKTMILKLSLNWSYQTLITTEIDLPVAFVFGSFNHNYIIQVAFHANFADQAQKKH